MHLTSITNYAIKYLIYAILRYEPLTSICSCIEGFVCVSVALSMCVGVCVGVCRWVGVCVCVGILKGVILCNTIS